MFGRFDDHLGQGGIGWDHGENIVFLFALGVDDTGAFVVVERLLEDPALHCYIGGQ